MEQFEALVLVKTGAILGYRRGICTRKSGIFETAWRDAVCSDTGIRKGMKYDSANYAGNSGATAVQGQEG